MDLWGALILDETLLVAYRRARHAVSTFEGLIDHAELADWESNLDVRLEDVRHLLRGEMEGIPCRLTPIPKGRDDARAYYSIPLKYQVGWLAIVATIGPLLDKRMPAWSFAYRLHRPRVRSMDGRWL